MFPSQRSKSAFLPTQPHPDCTVYTLPGRIPTLTAFGKTRDGTACAAAHLPAPFKKNPFGRTPSHLGQRCALWATRPPPAKGEPVRAQVLHPVRGVTIGCLLPRSRGDDAVKNERGKHAPHHPSTAASHNGDTRGIPGKRGSPARLGHPMVSGRAPLSGPNEPPFRQGVSAARA